METTVTAKKTTLKGGYLFFVAYLIFTLGFYALYNVNSLNVYYVSYYAHSKPGDGITIRSVTLQMQFWDSQTQLEYLLVDY